MKVIKITHTHTHTVDIQYILNLDTGSRKYWNICDLFVKCGLRTYMVHRGQGEFW